MINLKTKDDSKSSVSSIFLGGTKTVKKIFWSKDHIDVDTGKTGCWIISKEIEKTNQGVENGANKLINEAHHVITANMPNSKIKNLFAHCYGVFETGSNISAQFKFYWSGRTMGDLLRSKEVSLEVYRDSESLVFKTLFFKFYSENYQNKKADYWEKMFFRRIERRLKTINDLIEHDNNHKKRFNILRKVVSNGCVINDKNFFPISYYLKILRSSKKLINKLVPFSAQESHQDLNLNDIVVDFSEGEKRIKNFRLIDPRGVGEIPLSYRHFYYDGGKWLFVLDGLDIYRLYNKPLFKKFGDSLLVKFKDKNKPEFLFELNEGHLIVKRYMDARRSFINSLRSLPEFNDFKLQNPNWFKAILLSEACMYIPDVPCRMISDAYYDETIAIASYLRGIQLLDKFVNKYC